MRIDLSEFSIVTPPEKRTQCMALSLVQSGRVFFNRKLLEQLPTRKVTMRISQDATVMLLSEGEEPFLSVPKGGYIRLEAFIREVSQKGISLPARYIFERNEEQNMLMGRLERPVPPPKKKGKKIPPLKELV